ncbi:MAG: DUF2490 domain-containing protein [Flavobacterium sp.]|nr:DUF2490 domain-containing protein [Flavobacterium sp.]
MRKALLLLLALQFQFLYPQKAIENQANWFAYTGQYKLTSKWGLHAEAQFRMDEDIQFSKQNLFRMGAIYYPNQNTNFIVGYGLINTLNSAVDDYFKEDRIWEQYQHTCKWRGAKNVMINRLRLEQRFVDKIGLQNDQVVRVETNYQNRFRYFSRHLFHLKYINENKDECYAVVQDEVFLNIGSNEVNSNFFDQNRFFVGIGIQSNSNFRIEFGYLNQLINPDSGADLMNHTLSVGLFHNLTF